MPDQTKKLSDKIMLVTLSIHQWYPRKFDKKATSELAAAHGISAERAGRFNKILVDLKAIKPLQQRMRKLRDDHYAFTAPWGDNGERALVAELYFNYVETMRDAIQEIEALADKYEIQYSDEVDRARSELNTLFTEADYPESRDMRARFGVDYKFRPVANSEDVRVWGIGDDAATRIEQDVRTSVERQVQDAQAHVISQVIERAQEYIAKIRRYDAQVTEGVKGARLYDSAKDNLRDVIGLVLDGLNFTGDQELTKVATDIKAALNGTNCTALRNSQSTRIKSTEAVQTVIDKFQGVYG